jgi:hypothetical protein
VNTREIKLALLYVNGGKVKSLIIKGRDDFIKIPLRLLKFLKPSYPPYLPEPLSPTPPNP